MHGKLTVHSQLYSKLSRLLSYSNPHVVLDYGMRHAGMFRLSS